MRKVFTFFYRVRMQDALFVTTFFFFRLYLFAHISLKWNKYINISLLIERKIWEICRCGWKPERLIQRHLKQSKEIM